MEQARAAIAKATGPQVWRIWFDNCGLEPRQHVGPESSLPDDLNEARPWTEEDDLEWEESKATNPGA